MLLQLERVIVVFARRKLSILSPKVTGIILQKKSSLLKRERALFKKTASLIRAVVSNDESE
jgi:hypothetical protein